MPKITAFLGSTTQAPRVEPAKHDAEIPTLAGKIQADFNAKFGSVLRARKAYLNEQELAESLTQLKAFYQ